MLFNSYEFLFLFLPIVLMGYALLPKTGRLVFLTLASYLFYGWWDFRFCALMFTSTALDYAAGLFIGRATTHAVKKRWLIASVIANLSFLGFFKYFDLAADTINRVAGALGATHPLVPLLHIILPVGISFYTFQSMSYTIDVYFGAVRPQKSFWNFAFYVSFFPQLIAGPIVRYRDIEEQIEHRTHSYAKAATGISIFILGLAKKVLLADGVAPVAQHVFASQNPGFFDAWAGTLAYTAQIYFDFSGYSDMAVGLGLLFGFQFPQNFNSPYKAVSITDFWRRWHMSLSTWLRDYLYIPLGGNRRGPVRTYVNLFLTMLLGGLWHGANWTFLVWGGYHGIWLAIERRLGKRSWAGRFVALQRLATLLVVMVGWVFFRCDTLGKAADILSGMIGRSGWGGHALEPLQHAPAHLGILAVALALVFVAPTTWEIRYRGGWLIALLLALLAGLCIGVMLINSSSPFLYFQF